jgi:shikimate dehydrogenase
MTITGTTSLVGVAGWPISQSRSPLIHNYWFKLHGINAAYLPLPIAPDKFAEAVKGLQAAGFLGLNVTAPHKQAALALADIMSESAQYIGAANVLSFTDGGLAAANTDSAGFLQALKNAAPEWQKNAGPAVVLGAGGAARAVVHALIHDGVDTIRIVNRSPDHAHALESQFGRPLEIHGWGEADAAFAGAALLVNATSLGMQGQPRLEIPLEALPLNAVVNDLVNAPLETDLLASARRRGMVAVDGLGMLLHQAAAAFEIWFGVQPAIDEALRRYVTST